MASESFEIVQIIFRSFFFLSMNKWSVMRVKSHEMGIGRNLVQHLDDERNILTKFVAISPFPAYIYTYYYIEQLSNSHDKLLAEMPTFPWAFGVLFHSGLVQMAGGNLYQCLTRTGSTPGIDQNWLPKTCIVANSAVETSGTCF